MPQVTTKILVNWKTREIIHCPEHRGSSHYNHLITQGYVEAGAIKTEVEPKIYWDPLHFNPNAKYPEKPKNHG